MYIYIRIYTGGGVSVSFDEDGLGAYGDVVEEARTSSGVKQMITRSNFAQSEMCSLEAQFASSGNKIISFKFLKH